MAHFTPNDSVRNISKLLTPDDWRTLMYDIFLEPRKAESGKRKREELTSQNTFGRRQPWQV